MKNTALVFTGINIIGLISAFFLYSTTEVNPFQLFILGTISVSGFGIGLSNLILRSKHKATKWVRTSSLLLFFTTILLFIFPDAYNWLWNTILCLHVILIGYALFQLIPPISNVIFNISRGLIAITTLLFSAIVLFKTSSSTMYSIVYYCLILLTILVGFLFFFARLFTKKNTTN